MAEYTSASQLVVGRRYKIADIEINYGGTLTIGSTCTIVRINNDDIFVRGGGCRSCFLHPQDGTWVTSLPQRFEDLAEAISSKAELERLYV